MNIFQPYIITICWIVQNLKDLKSCLKKVFSDHGLHGGFNIMKNSTGKLNPHLDNSYHPKTDLLKI